MTSTRRGTLTILLGMAAGVGKTYAMLREGSYLRQQHTDVVIGYVDTHGRIDTEEQRERLDPLPSSHVLSRSRELDIDDILGSFPAPEVVLVDDLAEVIKRGGTKRQRYQDVDRLLEAGISVIGTVDVQFIDRYRDLMYDKRYTYDPIPIAFVYSADELYLIDIPPSALRERVRLGQVLPPGLTEWSLTEGFTLQRLSLLDSVAHQCIASWQSEELSDSSRDAYMQRWRRLNEPGQTSAQQLGTNGSRGAQLNLQAAIRSALYAVSRSRGDITVAAGLTVAIVVLIAAVRHIVPTPGLALLYIPVVLALALKRGYLAASIFSALAFLTYDFFFIQPVFSLQIQHPSDTLFLVLLLAVGLCTALVVSGAAKDVIRQKDEAEVAKLQQEVLRSLWEKLACPSDPDILWEKVAEELRDQTGSLSVALFMPDRDGKMVVAAQSIKEGLDCDVRDIAEAQKFRREAELARLRDQRVSMTLSSDLGTGSLEMLFVPLNSTEEGEVRNALAVVSVFDTVRNISAIRSPQESPKTKAAALRSTARLAMTYELFVQLCRYIAVTIDYSNLRLRRIEEEEERLKMRLLSDFAHDMSAPASVIAAQAERLLNCFKRQDMEDMDDAIFALTESAQSFDHFTQSLIELERMDRSNILHFETEQVAEAMTSLLQCVEYSTPKAMGRLRLTIADQVGTCAISLHPTSFERAMRNLVDNALKYSPENSEVRIEVGVGEENGWVEISVHNEGPDIPPEERASIFERFYRGKSLQSMKGSGIGLASCRAIIEAHNGHIQVKDAPEGGVTFALSLPTVDACMRAVVSGEVIRDESSA